MPMTMKAPVLHAVREPQRVETLELDDPKQHEVLVKMAASGVCHSCMYAWDGSNTAAKFPIVLGDEGSGTVEAGESLAVFGTGGVGLNAIQGGQVAGAYPLIAVDVADNKLEFARKLGATHVVNAAKENAVEAIQTITGRGADYAVVAVGSTQVQAQAYEAISRGGTVVVVGMAQSGELTINSRAPLVMQERCIKGSCYGSARPREDFIRLINLYLGGKLQIDELITRTYTMHEATEAFEDLEKGVLARGLIVF